MSVLFKDAIIIGIIGVETGEKDELLHFEKNNEDHHNYFDIMDKLDIHKSKRERRAFERLFFWYIRVDCEFWAWFGR